MTTSPEQPMGWSSRRAAEIVGITYRQIDYWARTGVVEPSLAVASGSGSRRRYSRGDLELLTMIRVLLDAGISLESVRVGIARLREEVAGSGGRFLLLAGTRAYLAASLEDLEGHGPVVHVVSLEDVRRDLDRSIATEEHRARLAAVG